MRRYEQLILLIGDLGVFYVSLALALLIRGGRDLLFQFSDVYALPFSILALVWMGVFFFFDFYTRKTFRSWTHFVQAFVQAIFVCAVLAVIFFYTAQTFEITPKTNLAIFLLIFSAGFVFWRMYVVQRWMMTEGQRRVIALMDVSGSLIPIIDEIRAYPFHRFTHDLDQAETIVVGGDLGEVTDERLYQYILDGKEVVDLQTYFQGIVQRIPMEIVSTNWMIRGFRDTNQHEFELAKRLFDISLSLFLLTLTLPAFIVIGVIIKLSSKGPVFYKQVRVGKGEKPFTLIKFRTMVQDAEKEGPQWAKEQDPRVTAVGRVLRHTHLDELPQLWNIVKGEMSFIGPRPERPEMIKKIKKHVPFYSLRHMVKPGITGWAQVNYKYGNSMNDVRRKLSYDLYYVRHRDLIFDGKIIFQTLASLWKGEGRNS